MADLGLLAGLANGIKEGMLAYQTQKQIRRQQDLENLNRGVVENPQTGELEYTPEAKQKMASEAYLKQLQLQKLEKEVSAPNLDEQYKQAQIDWLKSRSGESAARTGLVEQKTKGLLQPKTTGTVAGEGKPEKEPKIAGGTFTAGTFAQRVEDANKQLENLQSKMDTSSLKTAIESSKYVPQIAKSENVKLLEQAKRNFVNAVLRKESGAAISPSEFASAEAQYFDAPGDTEAVKEQKKRNREVALAGLRAEGEKALPKIQKGLMQAPQKAAPQMSPEDQEAASWLQQNPNHPAAKQIKAMLGAKYGL